MTLELILMAACAAAAALVMLPAPGSGTLAWGLVILMVGYAAVRHGRWQILPAAVAVAMLQLTAPVAGAAGVAALVAAVLLIVLSVVLVFGLPLRRMPAPAGRYGVGVVTVTLTDDERPVHAASEEAGRRLLVRIWYPAEPGYAGCREPLWQELTGHAETPRLIRMMLGYLKGVPTHTMPDAPAARELTAPPVVVYQHGLISFASENTLLMEHLASHGCIVVSLRHLAQLAEYRALSSRQSSDSRRRDAAIQTALAAADSRPERARLTAELARGATTTPAIVAARAADTVFVLDRLNGLLSSVPGLILSAVNTERAVLMGLSLGGAVATEVARQEPRCAGVVNLDGGLYGSDVDAPVGVPYLMIYSARGEGSNDLLLNNPGAPLTVTTLPGTTHLNLHDTAWVIPLTMRGDRRQRERARTLAARRPEAAQALAERNRLCEEFVTEMSGRPDPSAAELSGRA